MAHAHVSELDSQRTQAWGCCLVGDDRFHTPERLEAPEARLWPPRLPVLGRPSERSSLGWNLPGRGVASLTTSCWCCAVRVP